MSYTREQFTSMICQFCDRHLHQVRGGIITKKRADGVLEHRCAHGADCFETVAAKTIPPSV